MASEMIPPQTTTEAARFREVCFRLPEAAARFGHPLWIAVDNLGPGRTAGPR